MVGDLIGVGATIIKPVTPHDSLRKPSEHECPSQHVVTNRLGIGFPAWKHTNGIDWPSMSVETIVDRAVAPSAFLDYTGGKGHLRREQERAVREWRDVGREPASLGENLQRERPYKRAFAVKHRDPPQPEVVREQ